MAARVPENRFLLRLAAGNWIFRESDPGDYAFVIESGWVEITHGSNESAEVLARIGPGELLGEMALIDGRPRSASARAATEVHLRRVSFEQLSERLESADPLLRLLLKVMLSRYRDVLSPGSERPLQPEDADRRTVLDRLNLEQDLALALERGEFLLHYQPIVRLSDLRTAGFEGLIRWRHPTRGFVSPAAFIPVAEESELIIGMGAWVLREGCAALARMAPQGDQFMSVNLSGRQLTQGDDLVQTASTAALAAGVDPSRIKLEVTESLLLGDFEHAIAALGALRDAGFRNVVDDFGTGYSSLSYLHRLPVHTLKLDQSFVFRIVEDAASRKIVAAIGALAQALGMDVVAEGVESVAQAQLLRQMGFEYAQGYYFSRMVAEAEAAPLVSRQWSLPNPS